jgi:Flp pilus assembly protein TadD
VTHSPEFQKALSVDSTDVEAMVGAGICQNRLGAPAAAEPVLRRALARKPDHAVAHRELGTALAARAQYPEAVAQYRTAIQLDPEDVDAYVGLGSVLEKAGELPDAEDALKQGLQHAPRDARLHYRLALVYIDMNERDRARTFLETALDECGNDRALRATIQAALDSIK